MKKTGITVLLFTALFRPEYGHPQLCEGSLGDPIVWISFGAGSPVHAGALTSGTTSYTYSNADFPIDGSYTVENTTAGAGSVWWSTTDHTGNAGGYMMVVNASISLTDYFYKSTVTGLCPGTLYEFSAWLMNLLKSSDLSPPNITFQIEQTDGIILNSYNTGSIPLQSGPVWKQYGFFFETPPGVSQVVIRMRNNSAGGAPANDIALDDITFRPCGPDVLAWITGTSSTTDTVCTGSQLTIGLEATVSAGYAQPCFQWQEYLNGNWEYLAGATMLTMTLNTGSLTSGNHRYRLAAGECGNLQFSQCLVVSNEITIIAEAAPVAAYQVTDTLLCGNLPVLFDNTSVAPGEVSFTWEFGDGEGSYEVSPAHYYSGSGTYNTSLIAASPLGCADTVTRSVSVTLLPIPQALFTVTPTDTSILYPLIWLTDQSSGGTSCAVDWGDGTVTGCSESPHNYANPGTYLISEIVHDDEGCSDTAFATVIIRPEFRFFIPNAFTPNGDGLNDTFKPSLIGVSNYQFTVFNRFGEQIFETEDPATGWDGYFRGSLCPSECYVYRVGFHDAVSGGFQVRSGTFLLLK